MEKSFKKGVEAEFPFNRVGVRPCLYTNGRSEEGGGNCHGKQGQIT